MVGGGAAQQPQLLLPGADEYAAHVTERSQAVIRTTSCILDQPYGTDRLQRLDIFPPPPDTACSDAPVLMFFHGGAWRSGCKEWMAFMAPAVLALSAVFVSVSYRLAPRNRYPDQLHDALSAVAWVHRNIRRFGGDAGRIFVGGHSAGGHLASLASLRRDLYSSFDLPADPIRCCLPISAPLDLAGVSDRVLDEYLQDRADAAQGSPLQWVHGRGVPFVLSFGELDLPNVVADNREMIERLGRAGSCVTWMECPGASHFDTSARCVDDGHPWLAELGRILTGAQPRVGELVRAER